MYIAECCHSHACPNEMHRHPVRSRTIAAIINIHIKLICSIHSNGIRRFGCEKLLTMRAKSHSVSVPNDCSYHIYLGHKNYLRPAYERAPSPAFPSTRKLIKYDDQSKGRFPSIVPACDKDDYGADGKQSWTKRIGSFNESDNDENSAAEVAQNKRKQAHGKRTRHATLAEETSPAHKYLVQKIILVNFVKTEHKRPPLSAQHFIELHFFVTLLSLLLMFRT